MKAVVLYRDLGQTFVPVQQLVVQIALRMCAGRSFSRGDNVSFSKIELLAMLSDENQSI